MRAEYTDGVVSRCLTKLYLSHAFRDPSQYAFFVKAHHCR